MTALSDFVQVTITTTPQMPSQAGFGTPLIFAYHTAFADKVRTYSRLEDAVSDGIVSTGPDAGAYPALAAAFSQNPRPPQVKLGKRATAFTQILDFVPTTSTEGEVISLEIGMLGDEMTEITYEVPSSSSVALVIDNLKILIDALNLDVTVTDNTTKMTITADTAGQMFNIRNRKNLTLQDVTSLPSGMAADLDAVKAIDDEWYGVGLDSNSGAEIAAIADKVETYRKLFFTGNADSDVGTSATDDVMSGLQDESYFRTNFFYNSRDLLSYTGIAAMAENFPYLPGSSTYTFKTLAGVLVDVLSDTVRGYVQGKNGNVYIEVARTKNTHKGVSAAGEFIDIAVGRDWLQARLEEAVFGALRASRKIDYTDDGVDLIKAAVMGPIQAGIRQKFLAKTPKPVVTAPKVADISITDRQNRLLPDVTFTANLAGAIIAVALSGTISV